MNLKKTLKKEISQKYEEQKDKSLRQFIDDGISNLQKLLWLIEPKVPKEDDSFSAPFRVHKQNEFEGIHTPERFFTTAERSDMTYSILSRTQYGKKKSQMGLEKLLA